MRSFPNSIRSFNPAEAREGFKRKTFFIFIVSFSGVSIQPKPEKGLRVIYRYSVRMKKESGFNPAEAREGFKRKKKSSAKKVNPEFQSSRSQRRV